MRDVVPSVPRIHLHEPVEIDGAVVRVNEPAPKRDLVKRREVDL